MIRDGVRHNLELGKSGEALAEEFLKKNGYRVIRKNFRLRSAEIDLIASDKDTICFIEVKTRGQEAYGRPEEAVQQMKQKKISQCALYFLKANRLLDKKARFDVVSIIYTQGFPEVSLIKNAFELDASFTY